MQHSLMQFQFSNENGHTNSIRYWDEKLKHKITELTDKPKQLFVALTGQRLEHWKIVYNPKTHQFEKLELSSIFSNLGIQSMQSSLKYVNLLFNDQKNELVFYNDNIVQTLSLNNTQQTDLCFVHSVCCLAWYVDRQTSQRYLIIGCDYKIVIYNWETKQVITTLHDNAPRIKSVFVDEEAHDLLAVSDYGCINTWCLKTFTLKKRFITNNIQASIRFVNKAKTLFAAYNQNQNLEIWDKQSGECIQTRKRNEVGECKFLLYSNTLDLLITHTYSAEIECWKLRNDESGINPIFDEEHDFKIHDPFNKRSVVYVQFLDKNQTQLLACNIDGHFFVVDLLLKKVVWQKESVVDGDNYPLHVLMQ